MNTGLWDGERGRLPGFLPAGRETLPESKSADELPVRSVRHRAAREAGGYPGLRLLAREQGKSGGGRLAVLLLLPAGGAVPRGPARGRRWPTSASVGAGCWTGAPPVGGRPGSPGASFCHGWSGGPTYNLSADIVGIRPLKPGFAEVGVTPHWVGLRRAVAVVPTAGGEVRASWLRNERAPHGERAGRDRGRHPLRADAAQRRPGDHGPGSRPGWRRAAPRRPGRCDSASSGVGRPQFDVQEAGPALRRQRHAEPAARGVADQFRVARRRRQVARARKVVGEVFSPVSVGVDQQGDPERPGPPQQAK